MEAEPLFRCNHSLYGYRPVICHLDNRHAHQAFRQPQRDRHAAQPPRPALAERHGLGRIALQAGAHGLTVHPRPDQRHIRFSDLPAIRALIDDEFPQAEFNIEGYPSEDFLRLVEAHEPEQVTLVPDDPRQATSDHGWDFWKNHDLLKPIVARLKRQGIRVSLFADGDAGPEQIRLARQTGADRIELYTGPYGATYDDPAAAERLVGVLGRTADAARRGRARGQCRARPDGGEPAAAGRGGFRTWRRSRSATA